MRATGFSVLALGAVAFGCSSDDGDGGTSGGGGTMAGASGTSGKSGGGSAGVSGASGKGGAATGGGGAGPSGGVAGNTGATGGTGGGSPADAFWLEFARALCHHYMHCPGEPYGGEELTVTLNGDEERCAMLLSEDIRTRYPSIVALNAGVASGTYQIQQAAVEDCLTATARCGHATWNPPEDEIRFQDITPCREVFEGSVSEGGGCERDEDCAGDSRCGTSGCMGTCAPRLAVDSPCNEDRDCASQASDVYWPTCYPRDNVCVERWVARPDGLPEGSQCPGDGINNAYHCEDDLDCDAAEDCTVPEPSGESCSETTACLDGICVTGTCETFVIRRTAGEQCDDVSVRCDAFAGLVCSGSVCTDVETLPNYECDGPWFRQRLCGPALTRDCDGDSRG